MSPVRLMFRKIMSLDRLMFFLNHEPRQAHVLALRVCSTVRSDAADAHTTVIKHLNAASRISTMAAADLAADSHTASVAMRTHAMPRVSRSFLRHKVP